MDLGVDLHAPLIVIPQRQARPRRGQLGVGRAALTFSQQGGGAGRAIMFGSTRSRAEAALLVDLGTLKLTTEVITPETKAYFRNLEGVKLTEAQMEELRYLRPPSPLSSTPRRVGVVVVRTGGP